MFKSFLKKIENQQEKKLPFVVYRKPNESSVTAIFQNDDALNYVKDFSEIGFVFAPYNTDDLAVLMELDAIFKAEYVCEDVSNLVPSELPKELDANKAIHVNLVKEGIAKINKGDLKKVVLSRRIEVANKKSSLQLFQELLALYKNAFCYLWYHPKVGVWLGATPEVLLKTENNHISTMSLAGTQAVVANEDPIWVAKEVEEQEMVTQYIKSALEEKASPLRISETTSVKAGSLWHLRTSISGRMQNDGLKNIVDLLHPTPAVCGLPKSVANTFIQKNENYNREYYTGFLGELNFREERDRTNSSRNQENKAYRSIKIKSTLFVNLRCMKLQGDTATVYVGGGITKDSNPEKEWKETVDKSATLLQVIFSEV